MKKILIIEDDETLLKTLTTSLELEKYSVFSALDVEEGFRLAKNENLDLILLDLVLPKMDGYEICKNLRNSGNLTPIIFLTGEKKE